MFIKRTKRTLRGKTGFPKAHEIFAGNRGDPTTVADMLKVLQMRMGKSKDATVVVDRGMSNPENLASIRDAGYHWLVAAPQPERICYFEQFEKQKDWREIVREPSPRNGKPAKNPRTGQAGT